MMRERTGVPSSRRALCTFASALKILAEDSPGVKDFACAYNKVHAISCQRENIVALELHLTRGKVLQYSQDRMYIPSRRKGCL
ncbi:unnamed protein product [Ixodes persulcatus]